MVAACRVVGSSDASSLITASNEHSVIIVDDIMYLHSMRRAAYVATRDLGIHNLLIVRVTTDLSVALARNSLRMGSRRMSDETVSKIFNGFEEPNSTLVHEKVNLRIDTSTDMR